MGFAATGEEVEWEKWTKAVRLFTFLWPVGQKSNPES